MTVMPADGSGTAALRSVELLRSCGTVIAALLLAATVILSFLPAETEGFSWAPLLGTLLWSAVVAGLGWQRPRNLALAGTALVIVGITATMTLVGLEHWLDITHGGGGADPELHLSRDAVAVVLQAVLIGAFLLGGALASTIGEVEALRGRAAYTPKRMVLGVVAGAVVAGGLITVLYGYPELLEENSLLFPVCVMLAGGILVVGSAAVSPVALVPVLAGFLVLVQYGDNEALYRSREQEFQRHRLQLMITVLAAGSSTFPFRRQPEKVTPSRAADTDDAR